MDKQTKKSHDFFDKSLKYRHKRLGERLAAVARGNEAVGQAEAQQEKQAKTTSRAFRMASDFISAVVVGGLLGYGLDQFFSTQSIGLVFFVIIGFIAGVVNVIRFDKSCRNGQNQDKTSDQKS